MTDLEQRQSDLKTRSQAARKKGSSPKKDNKLRARVSEKTLLILLAQDARVTGQYRLEAIKLLLRLGGKLPAEELIQSAPREEEDPALPLQRGPQALLPARSR